MNNEPQEPLPQQHSEEPLLSETQPTESNSSPEAPSQPSSIEPDAAVPDQPAVQPPATGPTPKKHHHILLLSLLVIAAAIAAGLFYWNHTRSTSNSTAVVVKKTQTATVAPAPATTAQEVTTVTLQQTKNYGNKYKNGLLPVGDSKYVTSGAKKGYVYTCNANYKTQNAGASARGPWFVNNNTQWDVNKKLAVQGSVSWTPSLKIAIVNGKRVITTNDLPNHKTGVYPIASSDPAHQYDSNPNSIKTQSLSYTLNANPNPGSPQCMGGEVGVMLSGVALFNAFDAGGRDAGAWEVQDGCDGHPQISGEYHYHTLSRCITTADVKTVIGYALDGFPITGPKVADNNILTTDDLDECHGITSTITLDGKQVNMYHYVMTQDFPYSVSCFRSQAIQPPNQQAGTGGTAPTSGTQQPPSGMQQPPPPKPPLQQPR